MASFAMNGDALNAVVTVLRNASSQRPEVMKPAEQQLQQWEKQEGYYSTLLQVYLTKSLETNVRFMAVLCFKNCVEKYWRHVGEHRICESERAALRTQLVAINFQPEPLAVLSLQLAVVTGKVARQDCPSHWPDLLPALMQIITGGATATISPDVMPMVKQRALLTLHHSIKQVASRRLMHDRRKFQEVAGKLFPDIHQVFKSEMQLCLGTNESGGDLAMIGAALQRAHLCLKVLRKLAIYGFKTPSQVPHVAEFYSCMCEQIKLMLLFRKQHEGDTLYAPAEKYTNLLMKSLLELLENNPYCFLNYLRSTLEIATTFAFTDDAKDVMYERFTVQCLNMIKCILDCSEYHVNKIIENTKSTEALKAHKIKAEFFTRTVLEQICHRLITQYFLLSREDLEIWDSDPETFCTEVEGGDSWKFSLRPATEFLFKMMFHDYKDAFKPVLLSLLSDAVKMTDPGNLQGILTKDAAYNAIGLASFDLIDDIDFDSLFTSHLVHELKIVDSNYRILRRRVIWLVAQWTDVRFDPKNRPLLYEAFIHLLGNDSDFVVRYHAAMALKTAMDDFEFDRKSFSPYLPTIFGLLFNLLKEGKECDVKMQVLNVMSVMIEVVGAEVRPSVSPLVMFLPQLWQESSEHDLLRCAILTTLTHLVSGMGCDSTKLHGFLLEVLHISTDTSQSSHVYLLEDGLQLWYTTLENTPSIGSGTLANGADVGGSMATSGADGDVIPPVYANLLTLYGNLLPVMDTSTETLQTCTQITIAYILMCPRLFLQRYGRELLDILGGQLSDLKSDGVILILRIMEAIVRTCLVDGVVLVRGLLALIATKLVREPEAQYPSMVSSHISLLARVLLVDYDSFIWIINQLSKTCDESDEAVLTQLLRIYCSRLAVVTPDERRKLGALGLCRLIAVPLPAVVAVWGRAVEAVIEVIYDVTNEETKQDKLVISESDYGPDGNNGPIDDDSGHSGAADPALVAAYAEDDDAPPLYRYQTSWQDASGLMDLDCAHNKRRHSLARIDPVHTISLRQFLGNALMEFQRVASQELIVQVMTNINPDTKTMMQEITEDLK